MRPGVRVGVDVGSVRVGVAASDATAAVVLPVVSLPRDAAGGSDLAALARLVAERGAVEVVVGLPLGLTGREGPAAAAARAYARRLADRIAPVPVRLVDERFSTAEAVRILQPQRGRPRSRAGRGRAAAPHLDSRALRSVVDAEAAAIIVRTAIAEEAATGGLPGRAVPE